MRLDDLYHLPALAAALAQLQDERPGLVLVAGLDLPAGAADGPDALLPSGRTTILRVLAEAALAAASAPAAVIAAEDGLVRVSRAVRQRVALLRVQRRRGYAIRMAEARAGGARLLILDQLSAETAPLVAAALAAGVRVLTQLNSAARGAALLGELAGLGLAPEQLPAGSWLVAVRRLAMLCPACRRPTPLTPLQRLQLRRAAEVGLTADDAYFTAAGCAQCQRRGRSGSVALFDLGRLTRGADGGLALASVLALEQYAAELALRGDLALDDVVEPDAAQARRIFQQFTAGAEALGDSHRTLERRLAELRAANDVLERRTAALLSLQTIGQALISSNDLGDLAHRVCGHVGELCGAERCALYLLGEGGEAAILAVSGWDAGYVGMAVDGADLRSDSSEPSPFQGWPPGIPAQHADVAGAELRAGLCVPLMAEGRQLGMLIIHTVSRARFEPSEIALLQTFAHQAALSIQRTRLIEQLQANLVQLRAAQAALVEQERLAREMELAAEVQRSILPHVFPQLPGLTFAADNRPARQVGGDFYDIFMLDETTVGLVIADVSGKGMPAALYMALTRSLLLAEARRERSPREVLLNVNRLLREVGDPQMFVTVFYGVIATDSRELTFARAGHDYPLLFRQAEVERLGGRGTVLGMLDLEPAQLSEERLTLAQGDRLVLYTDGLTDVFNEANERLELPRLQAILQGQRGATPEAICAGTFAALGAFQGAAEQFDDMTIVVVGVA